MFSYRIPVGNSGRNGGPILQKRSDPYLYGNNVPVYRYGTAGFPDEHLPVSGYMTRVYAPYLYVGIFPAGALWTASVVNEDRKTAKLGQHPVHSSCSQIETLSSLIDWLIVQNIWLIDWSDKKVTVLTWENFCYVTKIDKNMFYLFIRRKKKHIFSKFQTKHWNIL